MKKLILFLAFLLYTPFCYADNEVSVDGVTVEGHQIQEEGVKVPQRLRLNFTGAGVAVTDVGKKTVVTIPGTETDPAGLDTYVQYNNGGAFGGESTFTYNDTLNSLAVDRLVIGPGVTDYLMPTGRGTINYILQETTGGGATAWVAPSSLGITLDDVCEAGATTDVTITLTDDDGGDGDIMLVIGDTDDADSAVISGSLSVGVGIGTSGPSAPGADLDVGGGSRTTIDGIDDILVADDIEVDGNAYIEGTATCVDDFDVTGTGPDITFTPTGGDAMGIHAESDIFIIKNETDNHQWFRAEGGQEIYLNPDSGNVSIGGGLGFPDKKLYVNGTCQITGATQLGSNLTMSGSSANIALGTNYLSGDGDDEGIYISSSGNVGIGTTSPTEKLVLAGDPVRMLFNDTGASGSTFKLVSNSGTFTIGDITNDADRLQIQSDGDVIINSGNVGIGTTGPGSKLTVLGGDIAVREDDDGNDAINLAATDAQGVLSVYAGGTRTIKLAGSTDDSFINAGNVGIGTTSPGVRLHTVAGTVANKIVDNNANSVLEQADARMQIISDNSGSYGSSLLLSNAEGSGDQRSWAFITRTSGSNNELQIGYRQSAAVEDIASTSNKVMTLLTNGNVGIGTTNPGAKLDATGTLRTTGKDSPSSGTGLEIAYDTGNNYGRIFAYDRTGSAYKDIYLGSSNQLYLKSGGNVGIGTTNPTAKLEVANGATSAGVIAIREDSDDGTNNVTFTVPALAADVDYTLPADDGDNLDFLQTNGSGVLDWVAGGAGGESLAATLAIGADANDIDITSLGKLEFFDAGLYLDADADGVMDITSDGTLELHSADWDISTTGEITNCSLAAADNVIEADTVLTITGLAPDTATTQATQGNITTCSNLVTVGALDGGSITSNFGAIDNGASNITTTGDITGGGIHVTGDTAAGDNAALGYTATEGLILTGQGSSNDITFKNDADGTFMHILTGTTELVFDAFPITPSAEPDADYEVANKKYVDDNAGGTPEWEASGTDIKVVTAGDDIDLDDGEDIKMGTGDDLKIYISNDDVYFENATQDKDIYIRTNDGGSSENPIQVHGDSGILTFSQQSSTGMYLGTADQENLVNNTWTLIELDADLYDTQSESDTGNNRITVIEAGKYLIIGLVTFDATDFVADKPYEVGIYVNGLAVSETYMISGADNNRHESCPIIFVADLSATNYVQLYVKSISGDNNVDIEYSSDKTQLTVNKIH